MVSTSQEPVSIPTSFSQADQVPCWHDAMTDGLIALEANQTWDLVPLLADASVIHSKWIYSIKEKSDGNIDRYKTRLVAQGFKQEYGIVYEETFAPVAKMTSVRALLGVVAIRYQPL